MENDDKSVSALLAALDTSQEVLGIDSRDANTPDNWIPRHAGLVRLTGKHPFNAEVLGIMFNCWISLTSGAVP
jgi:nitrate reductase (NAD(P)H)